MSTCQRAETNGLFENSKIVFFCVGCGGVVSGFGGTTVLGVRLARAREPRCSIIAQKILTFHYTRGRGSAGATVRYPRVATWPEMYLSLTFHPPTHPKP